MSASSFTQCVSKTALMVAGARAIESAKPNRAFEDTYAKSASFLKFKLNIGRLLCGEEGIELCNTFGNSHGMMFGGIDKFLGMITNRTVFFDSSITKATNEGFQRCILICGDDFRSTPNCYSCIWHGLPRF